MCSVPKLALFGNRGNMGSRYSACLNHLGYEFVGVDVPGLLPFPEKVEGRALIATPTGTHLELVQMLLKAGYDDILCEKPVHKDLAELAIILKEVEDAGAKISMVAQYRHVPPTGTWSGRGTKYDYFKHGADGIAWDCIQILNLHEGDVAEVVIREKSPIWMCRINGNNLAVQYMDGAYIQEIRSWIEGDEMISGQEIMKWHKRCVEYERIQEENSNRNSSTVNKQETAGESSRYH